MKKKISLLIVGILLATSFVGISSSLSNANNPQKTMIHEENDKIIISVQTQDPANFTIFGEEQIRSIPYANFTYTPENPTNTTIIHFTELRTQWNLISILYTKPINKTEIYVQYNGTNFNWTEATTTNNPTGEPLILGTIYGWNRTTQTYLLSDVLTPGDGDWMYAYYNCTLLQSIGVASTDSNDTYSYIIYRYNDLVCAKNGATGEIEKTSNEAAETFTYAITHTSADGGEIFVRHGGYEISWGLPIVQGLHIVGEGVISTSIILSRYANCPLFYYNGSTDIYFFTLEHLSITCQNGATSGTAIKTNSHVKDGLIYDCYVTGFKGHGIDLGTTWGWRIDQSVFEYMGGDGIHIHSGGDAYITNSKIIINAGNAINLNDSVAVTMMGNYIGSSGKNGVLFNGAEACVLIGNIIYLDDKYQTGLYSDIYVTGNAMNNIISGNYIEGGGKSKYNIYLGGTTASTKNIVSSNRMYDAISGTIYRSSSNTDLIKTNIGYTTENYGTCTITNSNVVTVNHGLSTIPKAISITPIGLLVSYYVDSVTATQFTLYVNKTTTVSCYWTAFA